MKTDVIVVGSGGAGFAAALTAARAGAKVTLLERAKVFGGTTAWSGAFIWVPNNSLMKAAGIKDSRSDALTYLKRLTLGWVSTDLVESFVDQAPKMVDWMMSEGMTWGILSNFPDYHAEFPGGKVGRAMEPKLFDTNRLGKVKDLLRSSPSDMPAEYSEIEKWGGTADMSGWDFGLVTDRMQKGIVGFGRAGIGKMMELCLKAGVEMVPDVRAMQLMREGKRISGVYATKGGQKTQYEARLGVILACGGFEWNPTLVHRFLSVPMVAPVSPPYNTGDGLLMSMEIGANLANMAEQIGMPALSIPGESTDGQPLSRPINPLRAMPGSIIVNRDGKRFVDEAHNYNDMAKSFGIFDAVKFDHPNVPAFVVFDSKFRSSYMVGTVGPTDRTPPWLNESSSLADLAKKIGVDSKGLEKQVAEFNRSAAKGKDPAFHRGETLYDRYYGDQRNKPNPSLRPIDTPPFFAVEARYGSLGTKGGPLTDAQARVLDVHDSPIPGLYAAGNVAASVFGPAYPGAGASVVTGWTYGWLAGQNIVK